MISKKVMSQCLTVDYCKGWNDAVDAICSELYSPITMCKRNSVSDLQYRALIGDRQAQEECTQKGIILPCPCCAESVEMMVVEPHSEHIGRLEYDYEGGAFLTCSCGYSISGESKEDVIRKHNTRPALQIPRCKFCGNKKKATVNDKGFLICPASGMEITDADFCSYFEEEKIEQKTYIHGSRKLSCDDIFFEDEIIDSGDGTINFYIGIYFNLTEVFGEKANIPSEDGDVTVYANYDINKDEVCDDLDVFCVKYGNGGADTEESYLYHLSQEEKKILKEKMFAYQDGVLNDLIKDHKL